MISLPVATSAARQQMLMAPACNQYLLYVSAGMNRHNVVMLMYVDIVLRYVCVNGTFWHKNLYIEADV